MNRGPMQAQHNFGLCEAYKGSHSAPPSLHSVSEVAITLQPKELIDGTWVTHLRKNCTRITQAQLLKHILISRRTSLPSVLVYAKIRKNMLLTSWFFENEWSPHQLQVSMEFKFDKVKGPRDVHCSHIFIKNKYTILGVSTKEVKTERHISATFRRYVASVASAGLPLRQCLHICKPVQAWSHRDCHKARFQCSLALVVVLMTWLHNWYHHRASSCCYKVLIGEWCYVGGMGGGLVHVTARTRVWHRCYCYNFNHQ